MMETYSLKEAVRPGEFNKDTHQGNCTVEGPAETIFRSEV